MGVLKEPMNDQRPNRGYGARVHMFWPTGHNLSDGRPEIGAHRATMVLGLFADQEPGLCAGFDLWV